MLQINLVYTVNEKLVLTLILMWMVLNTIFLLWIATPIRYKGFLIYPRMILPLLLWQLNCLLILWPIIVDKTIYFCKLLLATVFCLYVNFLFLFFVLLDVIYRLIYADDIFWDHIVFYLYNFFDVSYF